MKKLLSIVGGILVAVLVTGAVRAEIRSQVVEYQVDGQPFKGYLAYDESVTGKRPGVLVVHEWWGHNDYARRRADMLAQLGYTAFALDMYGSGKLAEHPEEATKFMQATLADIKVAEARFDKALQVLQEHDSVDSEKIAAIGYCFGGGTVLHMARAGMDLDGVVSFHGALATQTPAQSGQVKAQILVFNGADDPYVSIEQISAFKEEMSSAGVTYEFVNYPGVKHSFTNPDADEIGRRFEMPLVYDEAADRDSWQRMQQFLQHVFN